MTVLKNNKEILQKLDIPWCKGKVDLLKYCTLLLVEFFFNHYFYFNYFNWKLFSSMNEIMFKKTEKQADIASFLIKNNVFVVWQCEILPEL